MEGRGYGQGRGLVSVDGRGLDTFNGQAKLYVFFLGINLHLHLGNLIFFTGHLKKKIFCLFSFLFLIFGASVSSLL